MRPLALLCPILVVAVGLPSQTTHLVGPGGLPQIQDALAVAAAGDILHVAAGSYAGFTATIGVTIRALGQVTITGDAHCAPAAGQTLYLVGLETLFATVHVTGGRVVLDSCSGSISAVSSTAGPAAVLVANANVTLLHCSYHSGWTLASPALLCQDSHVTAVRCTLSSGGSLPVEAVRVDGGQLQLSHSFVSTFVLDGSSAPALRANGGAELWLSDSNFSAPAGQCPIEATGGASVRLSRSALSTTNCVPTLPVPPLLGIDQSGPIENGAPFTLTLRGAPNTLVAVHASTGLATTWLPGIFEQPLQLDHSAFWLAGLFVTDPTGTATASWNMPAGLYIDTSVWLEAITIEPNFPWQVAPVVGGMIR